MSRTCPSGSQDGQGSSGSVGRETSGLGLLWGSSSRNSPMWSRSHLTRRSSPCQTLMNNQSHSLKPSFGRTVSCKSDTPRTCLWSSTSWSKPNSSFFKTLQKETSLLASRFRTFFQRIWDSQVRRAVSLFPVSLTLQFPERRRGAGNQTPHSFL